MLSSIAFNTINIIRDDKIYDQGLQLLLNHLDRLCIRLNHPSVKPLDLGKDTFESL